MPQGDKHIKRFVAGFNLKTDFSYLNLDAVSAGTLTWSLGGACNFSGCFGTTYK
jgi:hypothetical protein